MRCIAVTMASLSIALGIDVSVSWAVRPDHPNRCNYAVDGECHAKDDTYGYYQTHWRRWPVECGSTGIYGSMRAPSGGLPNLELPEVKEETDYAPKSIHGTDTGGSGFSSQPNSQIPTTNDDYVDPFQDDLIMPSEPSMGPMNNGLQPELPSPDSEAKWNLQPPAGGAARGDIRPTPQIQAATPVKSYTGNPLRVSAATPATAHLSPSPNAGKPKLSEFKQQAPKQPAQQIQQVQAIEEIPESPLSAKNRSSSNPLRR